MFEPLLPEDKEVSTLKDISVVAIATVTQVGQSNQTFLKILLAMTLIEEVWF